MISRRFADKGMYRAKVSSAGRVLLPRYDTAHDIGAPLYTRVNCCTMSNYNELRKQWRAPRRWLRLNLFLCDFFVTELVRSILFAMSSEDWV